MVVEVLNSGEPLINQHHRVVHIVVAADPSEVEASDQSFSMRKFVRIY